MAGVTLDKLWLHDSNDLSTYLALYLDGEAEEISQLVESRRYANGRVRKISRPGTMRRLDLRLEQVARTEVDALRAWVGADLFLREPRGRAFFGFYRSISVDEINALDLSNVSLIFEEVTGTFEV